MEKRQRFVLSALINVQSTYLFLLLTKLFMFTKILIRGAQVLRSTFLFCISKTVASVFWGNDVEVDEATYM